MSRKKHVFVLGLDDFNREQLKTLRNNEHYTFHGILKRSDVDAPREYSVKELLERSGQEIQETGNPVDAIVGYFDFPVSTTLPLLRKNFYLPTPSLESVLKCEHKYWSRFIQDEVISDYIPRFQPFDPYDSDSISSIKLNFPFWIKPVKSLGSYLGFRINNKKQLQDCISLIRDNIGRIGQPFNYLLDKANVPYYIAPVDGYHCLAEEVISAGYQCTLEGYVYNYQTTVYGIVDSIRESNRISFNRYQYPSRLPHRITSRMIRIAQRILYHAGYNNSPFNMEFFYNKKKDSIYLLEINTRISESHCPIFQMRDGVSNQEVMVKVALGWDPDFPYEQGSYRCAAKFMPRRYQDGIVSNVPDKNRIREIEDQIGGVLIRLGIKEGSTLSELRDQDSYSYELGAIFVGGDDQKDVLKKYHQCLEAMDLHFADPKESVKSKVVPIPDV